MKVCIFLFLLIDIKSKNTPYQKKYPSIGKVGYHCEYLGTVERKIPEMKNEQKVAEDHYPTYGSKKQLTDDEKSQILSENYMIVTNAISSSGTYSAIDKNGVLYLQNSPVKDSNGTERKLYKHTSAVGMYFGNPSDKEPAITKKLTYIPRKYGFLPTGLYAPAGEILTIRISESDLQKVGILSIAIGQIFQNEQANVIGTNKIFVRMPIISNLFRLTASVSTAQKEGNDYIFYVGSFLGGPVYVKVPNSMTSTFSVTISGGLKMAHFILGYTTPEEFAQNWPSTAPYFEMEVWQRGIIHTGPKNQVTIRNYDDFYKAAIYWEKVTSVSTQIPSNSNTNMGIEMIYDTYVAAGGAVSFPGKSTTNCPASWLRVVLNYNNLIVEKEDSWGPHHEYNHHFQKDWGLNGDVEVSNNAVTLVSYSFFTKISQSRTLESEPTGYDNWAKYTSATFVLNNIVNNNRGNNLLFHACLLHCFGQYVFIQAAQLKGGRTNDAYYKAYTSVTELDMTYFFKTLYKLSISDAAINAFKGKNYKPFVPIAAKFQTGVGYLVKGKRNHMQTMSPMKINGDENFTLDFNKYLVFPKEFTFKVKNFTQPKNGQVIKQSENVYVYIPDKSQVYSGTFAFSVGLTKKDDSKFVVDDVEVYVNLQLSHEVREVNEKSKQRKLDRLTIWWKDGEMPHDPVQAFMSNYSGAIGFNDTLNSNQNENANTEMWPPLMKNTYTELRGKTRSNPAIIRFALCGRFHCALFLSFDEGKTYQLAVNFTNPLMDADFHLNDPKSYSDVKINKTQWIYFKAVLNQQDMPSGAGVRAPFVGIGTGVVKDDGTVKITRLANAYQQNYQPDPEFESVDIFPRNYSQTYNYEYAFNKGTLIDSKYDPWDDTFSINNLFDSNTSNFIHSGKTNPINEENPFMILVDLGVTLNVNKFIIYGVTGNAYQYQPKKFLLYVGTDQNDLQLVANVTDAKVSKNNVIVTFSNTFSVRYYKFIVTETYAQQNNYIAYRFAQFRLEFTGSTVALDDNRITLYNSWNREAKFCTFGHLYTAQGNQKSKSVSKLNTKEQENQDEKSIAEFNFTGYQYGINAFVSREYDGFDLYQDNKFVKRIDLNGTQNAVVPGVYISETLTNTNHSIRAESDTPFNIDSFILKSDESSVIQPQNEENNENNNNDSNHNNNKKKKKKLSGGAIAGIVIAVIVVVAIAIIVAIVLVRKRRQSF